MRTTQEVISKTNLTAGQNPDNHIDKLARLRNLLTKIGEPITDRRFTDIVPETPTDEKRDIKLMTYKHQTSISRLFDVYHVTPTWTGGRRPKREGLLDGAQPYHQRPHRLIPVSFSATTSARRGITGAASLCVPWPTRKVTSPPVRRTKSGSMGSAEQKWCFVHRRPRITKPSGTRKGLRAGGKA